MPRLFFVLLMIYFLSQTSLYALEAKAGHTVNINIPQSTSFKGDASNFTLTFNDSIKGSETDVITVNYNVSSNNVGRQSGVVQASVGVADENLGLMADVGSFVKEGGNGRLVESKSGFIPIGSTPVNLCDKVVEQGNGKVVRGHIVISYKAIANNDLSSENYQQTLMVTFIDN